jgi:hypothetical protein
MTRSDLAFPSPEYHASILATAGEGSAEAGLSIEKGASDFSLADTTATTYRPFQPLPPVPVAYVPTGGPLTRSLDTEHLESRQLDSVHSPYDIV